MYKRQALYNSGGVSKAMMEQYNTQMEAAASSLRQAQAQLITNSNQLSYTQLIADHDGVVANVLSLIHILLKHPLLNE